ncbi:MAG: hypothetical protein Q9O62_01115 [Ardenticatenia bacterium]|nr:hypothetical protein [Ardenticatenia bacterium]
MPLLAWWALDRAGIHLTEPTLPGRTYPLGFFILATLGWEAAVLGAAIELRNRPTPPSSIRREVGVWGLHALIALTTASVLLLTTLLAWEALILFRQTGVAECAFTLVFMGALFGVILWALNYEGVTHFRRWIRGVLVGEHTEDVLALLSQSALPPDQQAYFVNHIRSSGLTRALAQELLMALEDASLPTGNIRALQVHLQLEQTVRMWLEAESWQDGT